MIKYLLILICSLFIIITSDAQTENRPNTRKLNLTDTIITQSVDLNKVRSLDDDFTAGVVNPCDPYSVSISLHSPISGIWFINGQYVPECEGSEYCYSIGNECSATVYDLYNQEAHIYVSVDNVFKTTTSVKNVSCFGAKDGEVEFNSKEFSSVIDYKYILGDSSYTANNVLTIKNLSAGTYSCNITRNSNLLYSCDTIVQFTIGGPEQIQKNISDTINESETYNFNGLELSTEGIYYDTLTSVNTCDSIVILDLKVNTLPLSINNIDANSEISIFPNPSQTGIFTINSSTENLNNSVLNVYDITGKLIVSEKLENNKINLSNLASGIYSVEVKTEKGSVKERIVICK